MVRRVVALKKQLPFSTRGNTTSAMMFLKLCGLEQKSPLGLFSMGFFSVLLDSITSSTRFVCFFIVVCLSICSGFKLTACVES